MKTIFALIMVIALSSAFAATTQTTTKSGTAPSTSSGVGDMFGIKIAPQNQEAPPGQKHMVEFNGNFIPTFIYSLERSKVKGTDSKNESGLDMKFNYAYSIHPNVQIGGKFNYFNGITGNKDQEELTISAAAWFNAIANDLANSPYVSVALGTGWAQTFGENGARDDLWLATLAVGKRFSLENLGIKHVSYTPEIAFVNENSTSNKSFDYRQATEFRLLQFSVLW